MARKEQVTCDVCGAQKQETNLLWKIINWITVYRSFESKNERMRKLLEKKNA